MCGRKKEEGGNGMSHKQKTKPKMVLTECDTCSADYFSRFLVSLSFQTVASAWNRMACCVRVHDHMQWLADGVRPFISSSVPL